MRWKLSENILQRVPIFRKRNSKNMWFKIQLWLLGIIVRCLEKTWRYTYCGTENITQAVAKVEDNHTSARNYLLAIWHRFALPGVTSHAHRNLKPLVSHSKDGVMVTYIAKKFGLECVRGSSSRGGSMALREMLKTLKNGTIIAITVDGPRGPRGEVKPGIVDLAGLSHLPIIPLTIYPSKAWILQKTWDKTVIPKPFANIHVAYGEAVWITSRTEESRQNYRQIIAENLNACEQGLIKNLAQE